MIIYQHTAGDRTPFTYLLRCKTTNKVYYGVRYSKNCHPNQLWSSYFTSSKNVKKLIEQYGVENFEYEIRKTFNCPKKALKWEQTVLTRLRTIDDPRWINKSNGTHFRHNETLSDEIKQNMSAMRRGVKRPRTPEHQAAITAGLKGRAAHNKGKPMSDEQKAKLSAKAKGRPAKRKGIPLTDEHKAKVSKANKGRKLPPISDDERANRAIRASNTGFNKVCSGLIWVNDGVTSKRIKPEDFESSGFIRGRLR